jgi:hypothetical protein
MTRFFFNVRDKDGSISRDTEGQELPDLDAARREAGNASREMLGEELLHGGSFTGQQIEISDNSGNVLTVVNVEDTLLKDGHLRTFKDDVTQSAPIANLSGSKQGPR